MAVSTAVRRYYATEIFAKTGRDRAPPNFVPLDDPPTGTAHVEGCRGGGKNILEVAIVASGSGDVARIEDIRVSCGLCNPAMYAAADILCTWSRGRTAAEVLAVDGGDVDQLAPFYALLGGPGRPDDAREKFQYVLAAVQNAVRDHRGEAPVALPEIAEPTERDHDDPDAWDEP
ncbi:MAG: hypothetical protein QNJ98_08940 [Planctomycetota bacterium]|nr:hypothetical protein [Planctomycetota bacterium]